MSQTKGSGRSRVKIAYGPSKLVLTTTTADTKTGSWIAFGPFLANQFVSQITFAATSAGERCRFQGTLTTATTAGIVSFAVHNSSAAETQQYSGSTGLFAFVRLYSSVASSKGDMTGYFAAVP